MLCFWRLESIAKNFHSYYNSPWLCVYRSTVYNVHISRYVRTYVCVCVSAYFIFKCSWESFLLFKYKHLCVHVVHTVTHTQTDSNNHYHFSLQFQPLCTIGVMVLNSKWSPESKYLFISFDIDIVLCTVHTNNKHHIYIYINVYVYTIYIHHLKWFFFKMCGDGKRIFHRNHKL